MAPGGGPAVPTCMLLLGDRVILRATTPPEAEFALFEPGDIELRTSEPGRVREHGYGTTVDAARRRLGALGLHGRAVDAVVDALLPDVARAYARGDAVRRVLAHLGRRELLASETFDGDPPTYRGVYLDLAQLARDTGLPGAANTFRLLSLALSLEREPGDAMVSLSTDLYTRERRTGERTFRRPSFAAVAELEGAIVRLAGRRPAPVACEPLPRADVIAFLRERAHSAADEDEEALFAGLEREVLLRDKPERGPLAEPDIWEIELRLETERHEGVLQAIDAAERKYGKTPATSYLRGRAALALRTEHPRAIAERVSALALSMTSFQELSLLAADAWLDAGEPRRAVPFARDVVDAPGVDEGLALAARRLLARAAGAAPDLDIGPRSPGGSVAPRASAAPAPLRAGQRASNAPAAPTARPPAPVSSGRPPPVVLDVPPPPKTPEIVTPVTSFTLDVPGRLTPPPAPRASVPVPDLTRASEPPRPREPSLLPPTSPTDALTPRMPSVAPIPDLGAPRAFSQPPPRTSSTPRLERPAPSSRPGRTPSGLTRAPAAVRVETVAPAAVDPRAEPNDDGSIGPVPSQRPPRVDVHDPSFTARVSSSMRPQREDVRRTSDVPRTPSSGPARTRLVTPETARAAAAFPPWQIESPAPRLSRTPLLTPTGSPRLDEEAAESLSLPGALEDTAATTTLPRSILEARATFTKLARLLGREYRARRGVVLTTGVRGLETMQATLLEAFPDHEVRTDDQAELVAAHGAFFAEVLARTLDAEWFDLDGPDVTTWSMIVAPDARVWPFARVARLVAMGHRERDLVATYLEVSGRRPAR